METELGIEWTTERRRVGDLIEWTHNPRQLTEKEAADLHASLKRFGYVEPIAINVDGTILGGHMRRKVLMAQAMLDPNEEIEVRVPSRALTIDEIAELNIRLNRNTGGWDMDKLANEFNFDALVSWGFSEQALTGWTPPAADARPAEPMQPLKVTRPPEVVWVLVAIPIEKYGRLQPHVEALEAHCEVKAQVSRPCE